MIELTKQQREELNKIWFIYGNHGKKSTHFNHRYIQCMLEHGEDQLEFYKNANTSMSEKAGISKDTLILTNECIDAVNNILQNK